MARKQRPIRSKPHTPSFTEWLKEINTPSAKILLKEDNTKYDRLEVLNKFIGLPYTQPIKMEVEDILNRSDFLKSVLKMLENKHCILRLVPTSCELPKIRRKGGLLKNNLRWLYQKKINPSNYTVEILPRNPNVKYAAIFIVDDRGIWGEIVKGGLSQLVRGKFNRTPTIFSYDFSKWRFSKEKNQREKQIIKEAISKIEVLDEGKKKMLKKELQTSFTKKNFIKGYFEFTVWPDGIKFVDYNRFQSSTFAGFNVWRSVTKEEKKLHGICANQGAAHGRVLVVNGKEIKNLKSGQILVSKMITIKHLPLMKKARAIITEEGTILCHAALVSRELSKPCVIQVKNATKILKNGEKIFVNASAGTITKL